MRTLRPGTLSMEGQVCAAGVGRWHCHSNEETYTGEG